MAELNMPAADLAAMSEHFESWRRHMERFKADPAMLVAKNLAAIDNSMAKMSMALDEVYAYDDPISSVYAWANPTVYSAKPKEISDEQGARWLRCFLQGKQDPEQLWTAINEMNRKIIAPHIVCQASNSMKASVSLLLTQALNMKEWKSDKKRKVYLHKKLETVKPDVMYDDYQEHPKKRDSDDIRSTPAVIVDNGAYDSP